MKKEKLKYFAIFQADGELGAERSDHVRRWVDEVLLPSGLATENEDEANAYLVATGDGGMTKAARTKCEEGKLLFGINCGTLGFLMNQVNSLEYIPRYKEDLNLVTVNLLKGTFYCRDGKVHSYLAFNDIFCGGNIADYVSFDIQGSLSHFRNRTVKGNGVFVSTPQGTTGFALNARGSAAVLPLDTRTWYIGGVATGPYPCSVFSPQRVEISVKSRQPVFGYADGYDQEARDIEHIVIEPTDHHVSLGFLADVDFECRRRDLAQRVEIGSL
ncbi:MAG: hypothetical protein HRT88_01745 [Lentisphaeraceae bacterium]|nr:hypothetical protein [Lentisphaeraceae bacterium]